MSSIIYLSQPILADFMQQTLHRVYDEFVRDANLLAPVSLKGMDKLAQGCPRDESRRAERGSSRQGAKDAKNG